MIIALELRYYLLTKYRHICIRIHAHAILRESFREADYGMKSMTSEMKAVRFY